ncbi:glycoside hydrolase family 9 protein [Solicola gregarius]|uniref:Glycoside hydrolase family 9 protein n=1 Tax=Solicola gregarius TaxID=2908642 RepID=A0AA46TLQ8_9ACTN|nr:glycoside hydrolase family 9 protein [Solicola gregarius]UYM07247.1 glycoside hydrolase family 9 protein [Solicola gregarius]
MIRRTIALVGAFACASALLAAPPAHAAAPEAGVNRAFVRVNQVGYLPHEPKVAYAMTRRSAPHARYVVVRRGEVVRRGRLGKDVGRWSKRWRHVYRIRLGGLQRRGTYRIVVRGSANGRSPGFRIAPGRRLYRPLRRHAVMFFRTQRDGSNVPSGQLHRRPSHLADRRAGTYAKPRYRHGRLVGRPRKIAGPVDVSGGWFDAGDYLKFVETSTYADALLLVAARKTPGDKRLRREAMYGLRWLDKMWRDRTKTLLYQVGIGDGGKSVVGDHDLWRLPQRDDRLRVRRGDPKFFIKHRPAFRAGKPGARISPNLAGRLAAVFALGAQLEARKHPDRARALLRKARTVLHLARTKNAGRLLTTSPHSYYEEDEWRDDMELGATEIAVATRKLGRPHVRRDLRRAARWARAYVRGPHHGWYTLARDDNSAIAHADLARALSRRGGRGARCFEAGARTRPTLPAARRQA